MQLLITRSEPDAGDLETVLESIGHRGITEPLLSIEFGDCDKIDLSRVQALIATSRNALRALAESPVLEEATKIPLYAVGQGTAALARQMGFTAVHCGPGRAEALVPVITRMLLPGGGALLHLAGADLASDIAGPLRRAGFEVMQPVVYRALGAERLSAGTQTKLRARSIDGVILMSPRTAGIYTRLIDAAGLAEAVRGLVHYCLSGTVARALHGLDIDRIEVPARPNMEEMLAMLASSAERLP